MKKTLFTTILMLIGVMVFAQTRLYVNPKFSQIAKNQKIIAIIPFSTTIQLRPRQMRNTSPEQLKTMEMNEGEGVQTALYSWFLKRGSKGKLLVQVQDPNVTNIKLKRAGVKIEKYSEHTPAEIAKILGVDALVMGTLKTTKPMSAGVSAALGVLVGAWGVTNRATMNLFIYNASDGAVLLNYNKGIRGSLGSSTQDMVNILMRKASRRIAYVSK
jgi:hypothetical protein